MANILEEKGWCQHAWVNQDGARCALAAFWEVAPMESWGILRNKLQDHLGCNISVWNDASWQTKENVLRTLRSIC